MKNLLFSANADRSGVTYNGDLDDFDVSISKTTRVAVNLNGHSLFKEEVDVFEVFAEIRDRRSMKTIQRV